MESKRDFFVAQLENPHWIDVFHFEKDSPASYARYALKKGWLKASIRESRHEPTGRNMFGLGTNQQPFCFIMKSTWNHPWKLGISS